jgi:hypothetical protein
VEAVQPYIIPTVSKSKISHHLSYPVGAAAVSTALASVTQLPELKLHFYFYSEHSLRRGHYEFLRVEYLNNALPPAAEWPIWLLYSRPPQYRWEIIVQAVPRVNRHRINEYILKTALPQVGIWLSERTGLSQQGNDMLTFFYDEKAEKFESRLVTRLEPLRRS